MIRVSPVWGTARTTIGGEYLSSTFHSGVSLPLLRRVFFILVRFPLSLALALQAQPG
jgi:hypothetical protein